VDIDHTAWLGHTREAIGHEKAGIFRAGRPAICGDPNPPAIIAVEAARIGSRLLQYNQDFFVERSGTEWTWRHGDRLRAGLPYPSLRGDYQLFNAACALTALDMVADRFPVTQADVREGLISGVIPGRFQVLPGRPVRVSMWRTTRRRRARAATLKQQRIEGRTLASSACLDKDIVSGSVPWPAWWIAGIRQRCTRRGRHCGAADRIACRRRRAIGAGYDDVHQAHAAAQRDATEADRLVVFGSSHGR
jgi:dihydrofolate synthase/folylpolyglutamate synthase